MTERLRPGAPHVFLSCGEASGERYGAELVAALRQLRPDARFSGLGGDDLAAAGVDLVCRRDEVSVMGFGEVLRALPALRRARARLRRHLETGGVDLFVPVDFPGFNLGLAARARNLGIPVFYLVAPQLWAWGGWRIGQVRRAVDRLGVLLPFEEEYFRSRRVPAVWLGHPLVELYDKETVDRARRRREARLREGTADLRVGLLPGSRRQELTRMLPLMLDALDGLKRRAPGRKFKGIVSRAPGVAAGELDPARAAGHEIVTAPLSDLTPDLDLALVCSGTASLETALAGVPHALAYRTSALNHWLGSRLVRVERIGLANLALGHDMVREFVQGDATPEALAADLSLWQENASRRARFASRTDELREALGAPGVWSRAAASALALLEPVPSG